MSREELDQLIAVCCSDLGEARRMLLADPSLVRLRTPHMGETAFHYVAIENQVDAMRLLLEFGAEVDTRNECNDTPLLDCASIGNIDAVRFLVDNGADLNAINSVGDRVLHVACRSGHLECVRLLLDHGADVSARDDMGRIALHTAVEMGDYSDVVSLPIERGAIANTVDIGGWSPLHYAAFSNSPQSTALLLRAGADRAVLNCFGDTPEAIALRENYQGIVDVLRSQQGGHHVA